MLSLFSDRLGTNYVPSDEEIEQIKADLFSRTKELARLDNRIRELSEQRDKIQGYVDSHKALISHPRRLPLDILEAIFLACLPTERNAAMTVREAPLLLCRICSSWRVAGREFMARLWTSLHISVDFVTVKASRNEAVDQWLQRAATCPISLSIAHGAWGWPVPTDEAVRALAKSLPTSWSSWRHVKFVSMSSVMSQVFEGIRQAPPRLESFIFTGDLSLLSPLNLLDAPSLRHLSLQTHDHLHFAPSLSVAWHELTHLGLNALRTQNKRYPSGISFSYSKNVRSLYHSLRRPQAPLKYQLILGCHKQSFPSWIHSSSPPIGA
ncbi:hypothetical protein R3P38DRAFT_3021953 [Favolaschia claudopus]|uniref:F-box domain-containing protein n=1 Tax=Favolaschia claudopus TaxID=2862362 RepID=A0AAW0AHX7_9AGAR